MPSVQYGSQTIEYSILEKEGLKAHYISVEKGIGVTLKGAAVSREKSQELILKKARWIIDKLELVRSVEPSALVTGSRMPYLGKNYYVQINVQEDLKKVEVVFNHSKFKVNLPTFLNKQEKIKEAFENFYRQKAIEKISPRLKKWSKEINLPYKNLQFRKLEKRWGSCTPSNTIVINIDAVKLPFSLIDYLLVHELVHTKIKNHSKEFWAELSQYMDNWRALDARMQGLSL
ncbi:MAG: M48 family metallopeptidase [Aureispira sp.]